MFYFEATESIRPHASRHSTTYSPQPTVSGYATTCCFLMSSRLCCTGVPPDSCGTGPEGRSCALHCVCPELFLPFNIVGGLLHCQGRFLTLMPCLLLAMPPPPCCLSQQPSGVDCFSSDYDQASGRRRALTLQPTELVASTPFSPAHQVPSPSSSCTRGRAMLRWELWRV